MQPGPLGLVDTDGFLGASSPVSESLPLPTEEAPTSGPWLLTPSPPTLPHPANKETPGITVASPRLGYALSLGDSAAGALQAITWKPMGTEPSILTQVDSPRELKVGALAKAVYS